MGFGSGSFGATSSGAASFAADGFAASAFGPPKKEAAGGGGFEGSALPADPLKKGNPRGMSQHVAQVGMVAESFSSGKRVPEVMHFR